MAHTNTREKAQALRRRGASIKEIAHALDTSPSTISYWCRNIVLTKSQIKNLVLRQKRAGARGRLRAAEKKRALRFKMTKEQEKRGQKDIGLFSERDLFILGLALYWGEGYKNDNGECGLTNSDPDIIKAYIVWLKSAYKIPAADLILRVSINFAHRARVKKVEKIWSSATGIPLSQFTKTSLIRSQSRKTYSDPEKHFGTLRVKVRRATNLRRRIIGSLNEIRTRIQ